jgi:hypothetical protein
MKTLVKQTKGNGKRSFLISHFSFFIFHCSLFIVLCSLFIFSFSLSCKTVEKTPGFIFEAATVIPLEQGASAYILTNIRETKSFLDVQDKSLQQIIDGTQYAAAAFYSSASNDAATDTRRYHLSAWGSYPSSRAKTA